MISCPNCGKDIDDGSVHCGHCGHKIEVESKKTIMGFGGAVDASALRDKLNEAKAKKNQGGASQSSAAAGASDMAMEGEAAEMAPTQMMDTVPTPEGEGASDLETAPTEMMDQPGPSDFDDMEEGEDEAFAATKAMSTLETEKVESSGQSVPEATADPSVPEGGPSSVQIEGGLELDTSEPSEKAAPPTDQSGPVQDQPAASEPVQDQQAASEPAQDDGDGGAARAGGRDLMQMRRGGGGDAQEEVGEDGDAVAGMDDYLDDDEEEGGLAQNKLLIGVVAAVLLLGCCGAGSVGLYFAL